MTTELFRAVSQQELNSITETGIFRTIPESLAAKQFGRNLGEVIQLAGFFSDAVAIVRIRIPQNILNELDLTPVDQPILKSGTVTAHESEQLNLLNNSLIGDIELIYSE